jgi:hypothetical protein
MFQRVNHNAAIGLVFLVSGNDNVGSVWKWFSNRFKRMTPHDNGMAASHSFEKFQVIWQVPNELVVFANDVVFIGRHYHTDHTAIGALIPGCGL